MLLEVNDPLIIHFVKDEINL